jgi:hypothetical protein
MHEEIAEKWLKLVWIPASVFLCLPVVLAFFNQPTIDDYWYTFMVKEHGFWQAQVVWNQTINARFSSNAFMSLNSLVWGKTWFFKVFPVLLICGYVLFFRAMVQQLFPHRKGVQVVQFSLVVCCAYAIGLPGYYEGFFWSSALAGYQLSWLSMCTGFLLWFRYRHSKISALRLVAWVIAGVIVGGFHELIGFFTVGIACCIALWVHVGKKKYNTAWLWFAFGALASLVFQALSRGNYQKAQIIANKEVTRDLWIFIQPFIQFAYHMVRGFLLNPMWWAPCITMVLWCRKPSLQVRQFAFRKPSRLWVIISVLIILAVFPAFFVGVIEGAKTSLRVIHLGYGLLFLAGIVGLRLFSFLLGRFSPAIVWVMGYRKTLVSLLVVALFFKTTDLIMPLVSGQAYQYNKEVENRFALIRAMKGNQVVTVPCLKAQPMVLCPVDICNDPTLLGYLERVFQQKLIIGDAEVSPKPSL